jgi:hypothetical protein
MLVSSWLQQRFWVGPSGSSNSALKGSVRSSLEPFAPYNQSPYEILCILQKYPSCQKVLTSSSFFSFRYMDLYGPVYNELSKTSLDQRNCNWCCNWHCNWCCNWHEATGTATATVAGTAIAIGIAILEDCRSDPRKRCTLLR